MEEIRKPLYRLGIDFGTTTTYVSMSTDNNKPKILNLHGNDDKGEDNNYLLSSCVIRDGKKPIVGLPREKGLQFGEDYIYSPKLYLSLCAKKTISEKEIRKYLDACFYILDEAIERAWNYLKNEEGGEFSEWKKEDLLALPVRMGCGANFGHDERELLAEICRRCGFKRFTIGDIGEEPILAMKGQCYNNKFFLNKCGKVLVYDFGGGTFDVSIMHFENAIEGRPEFTILGTAGSELLTSAESGLQGLISGDRIDDLIKDYFIKTYFAGKTLSKGDEGRLLKSAKEAKESLSNQDKWDESHVFGREKKLVTLTLKRTDFEDLLEESGIFEESIAKIREASRMAELSMEATAAGFIKDNLNNNGNKDNSDLGKWIETREFLSKSCLIDEVCNMIGNWLKEDIDKERIKKELEVEIPKDLSDTAQNVDIKKEMLFEYMLKLKKPDHLYLLNMGKIFSSEYNERLFVTENIEYVLLVGGCSKIPYIRKRLAELYGEEKIVDSDDVDCQEFVGHGACLKSELSECSFVHLPYSVSIGEKCIYQAFDSIDYFSDFRQYGTSQMKDRIENDISSEFVNLTFPDDTVMHSIGLYFTVGKQENNNAYICYAFYLNEWIQIKINRTDNHYKVIVNHGNLKFVKLDTLKYIVKLLEGISKPWEEILKPWEEISEPWEEISELWKKVLELWEENLRPWKDISEQMKDFVIFKKYMGFMRNDLSAEEFPDWFSFTRKAFKGYEELKGPLSYEVFENADGSITFKYPNIPVLKFNDINSPLPRDISLREERSYSFVGEGALLVEVFRNEFPLKGYQSKNFAIPFMQTTYQKYIAKVKKGNNPSGIIHDNWPLGDLITR